MNIIHLFQYEADSLNMHNKSLAIDCSLSFFSSDISTKQNIKSIYIYRLLCLSY